MVTNASYSTARRKRYRARLNLGRIVAAKSLVIAPFRNLPGEVEIIGLGKIRRQSGVALEAEVEVELLSLTDESSFDPDVHLHKRWVGCGQLDLLAVGSRWERGRHTGTATAEEHRGSFRAVGKERIGLGCEQRREDSRFLPSRSSGLAPCFLLERESSAATQYNGPRKVLLPYAELVRAMFGVSGRFLLQLLDGLREPFALDRGLIDRSKSAVLEDGTIRLVCWRRPTDDEALILAAMISKPEIMRLHDSVLQQLIVQPDFRNGGSGHLVVDWPFAGEVGLKIEGTWFERVDGFKRFLVTRILELDLGLPFRRIEVHHLGSGSEDRPDRAPPPRGRLRAVSAPTLLLTTGRPPTASKRPGELTSMPLDIVGANTISIDYFSKGGPPRPATSTIAGAKSSEAEVSTASRTAGGDSEVGRVEVRRISSGGNGPRVDQYRADSLRVTMTAIEAAAASMGWKVTPYPKSGLYLPGATAGAFDFDREGILVGLNVRGRHILLVDSGTGTGDRRSLGILVPTMTRPVAEYDLATIRDAERNGIRWGSAATKLAGFAIHAVRRHPKVWKMGSSYADPIRSRVEQAILSSVR